MKLATLNKVTPTPEGSRSSTPLLRTLDGRQIAILDYGEEAYGNKGKVRPTVTVTGGLVYQSSKAVNKTLRERFAALDQYVLDHNGDKAAMKEVELPESVDLNKPETWRYFDVSVKAMERGVEIE